MKRSAIIPKPPRARKCAICREPATSAMNLKPFCSPRCGLELAKLTLAKQERARDKAKREGMMNLSQWTKAAEREFNRYIRLRDHGLPCICCGKPMEPNRPGGSVDAGHYLSVGSSKHLRFVEMNVNAQRKSCNRPGGADRGLFRAGMVARYGEAAVAELEADQAPRQYRIPDLKAMRDDYRQRANALAKALKDD